MIIDLIHNKIVRSTVSDKFTESVNKNLMPLLETKYGDALIGIQMYEDYLTDKFSVGKEWYYPLTVFTSGGAVTQWISWTLKKGDFEKDIPYTYVGDALLEFSLVTDIPSGFAEKLAGRSTYFEGDTVKVRVETTATDVTVLAGRYSQTFIDEMARQLTGVLENAMDVIGIAGSSIEIAIVFTPDTYLEHTSESVTYRRLLIVDKSSSPRDLWIKWTRKDGNGAYSVSDHIDPENIVFELGEDVAQKIREKEYRFLLRASKERYHKSMGRKNITEWRDVLKRAARRGDLERVGGEDALAVAEAKAAEATTVPAAPAVETAPVKEIEMTEDEELALAMEMAKRAMDSVNNAPDVEIVDDEDDAEDEELDELDRFYSEDVTDADAGVVASDDDEQRELDEITRMAMEALKLARAEETEEKPEEKPQPALVTFDDEVEEIIEGTETDEIIDEDELDDEIAISDARALEPDDEATEAVATVETTPATENIATTVIVEKTTSTAELEAKIRDELEAKIRLEYETRARAKAEEEAEKLRREQEQLRLENERLQERARREKFEWTRLEENRRAENEKLRAQIEAQLRQEARERERLAEAARAALEEQHRLELEKLKEERLKLEETRRQDEERRRAEEAARIEAERRAEAERLRRAEAEKAKEEPKYVDNNYTYVSKTVRLIFRRSVDPNITARLHEIIKATLEYYGKDKVYMRVKASIPDTTSVCLEFVKIPLEEMELLSNIIKVIGNSGLGIAKAILE